MKTFLWTTLFWIVAAIAGLLCLGFGNLWTQVLENEWLVSIMPKNLQTKICEPVVATAMEWVDRCAEAEANNCEKEEQESETEHLTWETAWLQEPLSSIIANQEIIYNYIQESVASINQSISDLKNNVYVSPVEEENQVVDEREQQRLQLQAQIDALQNEMESLY